MMRLAKCALGLAIRSVDGEDNAAYFNEWLMGGRKRRFCSERTIANPDRIGMGEWMGRDKFVGAFKAIYQGSKAAMLIILTS